MNRSLTSRQAAASSASSVELGPQPLDVLADALVVEADPLLHRQLGLGPRRALEAALRLRARLPEEPVVPVEALDQDGCDSLSGRFSIHETKSRRVSADTHIQVPAGGAKIVPGEPTPDNPIIPFIEGDGIGVDITPVMKDVVDAAVERRLRRRAADPLDGDLRRREGDVASTAATSGCPRRRSRRCASTPSRSRGR